MTDAAAAVEIRDAVLAVAEQLEDMVALVAHVDARNVTATSPGA